MKMEITQYGLSDKAGGWDGVGDSGTDKFEGNENNLIVNGVSCALSPLARTALGAKDGQTVKVTFPNEVVYHRQVADSTDNLPNQRVDFFNAYAFDKQMDKFGEEADVVLIEETLSVAAPRSMSNWRDWLP